VAKVLLDTNTYSLFKNGHSEDANSILEAADEIGLPNVVIAELYAGFYEGTRFAQNERELEMFLQTPQTSVVWFSDQTPKIFGEQQLRLKKQGVKVPHNDLWIAALALEHGFVVYSLDKHLKMISSITVIQSFQEFLDLA
jgi:predicted nucleic acid-binding protein